MPLRRPGQGPDSRVPARTLFAGQRHSLALLTYESASTLDENERNVIIMTHVQPHEIRDPDWRDTIDDADDNGGFLLASVQPAMPQSVHSVISAREDADDGRSQWLWIRLSEGTIVLGVFPQGATYEDIELESSTPYEHPLHPINAYVTVPNPDDVNDVPVYDGQASEAGMKLAPGAYRAYNLNREEGVLIVEGSEMSRFHHWKE